MDIADFMIDPARLSPDSALWEAPLAFVELAAVDDGDIPPVRLPPCPTIGLGDPAHPLASMLDTVLEAPVSADLVASQVLANPLAAATVVQLLRMIPDISLEAALTAESMAYAMLQGSSEHRGWRRRQEPSSGAPVPEGVIGLDREGPVLVITLDRPAAGNAIDRSMRDGLYEAFALGAADDEIERIVLRGRGKTFSLGADLMEFGTTIDPVLAHDIRMRILPARQAIRCAHKIDVHAGGACIGAGLELAALAARFTAAPNAWFQLPELAMGILPGAGGCVSLTRRLGRQRAALMILSGKRLSARQALAWGLIDAIVDEPA